MGPGQAYQQERLMTTLAAPRVILFPRQTPLPFTESSELILFMLPSDLGPRRGVRAQPRDKAVCLPKVNGKRRGSNCPQIFFPREFCDVILAALSGSERL